VPWDLLSRGRVVTNLQNDLDGSLSNGFVRITCHTDEQILAVAPVEVGQHNILLILWQRLVHLHGLEVSSKIRQMICVKNRNRKQPFFYLYRLGEGKVGIYRVYKSREKQDPKFIGYIQKINA
jgi:hypothetical protein